MHLGCGVPPSSVIISKTTQESHWWKIAALEITKKSFFNILILASQLRLTFRERERAAKIELCLKIPFNRSKFHMNMSSRIEVFKKDWRRSLSSATFLNFYAWFPFFLIFFILLICLFIFLFIYLNWTCRTRNLT